MEFFNVKEKLPEKELEVLTWDGISFRVQFLYWMEKELPVFFDSNGSHRDIVSWAFLPNQPERLSEMASKEDAIV